MTVTETVTRDPDRNRLVRALFDRAADLPPAEWGPFLERECPEDAGIRGEVLRLLRGGQRASADRFLVPPCGPPEADPAQIGKYRVVRRFAEKSGQAAAYLAFDPDLARHVVLKQYKAWDTDEDRRVMAEEGRALARVRSPFVAQCFGIETHEDAAFLVVEYVPGRNLAEVRRDGPLEAARVVALLRHLAEGVAAVHACGLIHRDLKPANVILGDDDRPRLVDFGLAAPLGSDRLRELCGSPSYMAPEQARGESERIDYRTDIFGLGAVLYELLTGHPLFEETTLGAALDLARNAVYAPPRRTDPSIPIWLEEVCLRALAKAPEARYSTAAEFADALRRDAGAVAGGDRASLPLPGRRHGPGRAMVAAGALLLVTLAFLARSRPFGPAPSVPLRVDSFDVRQYRGEPLRFVGTIGGISDAGRADDNVRVSIRLHEPAYCYLLALNPDGTIAFCPRGQVDTPPAPTKEIHYPAGEKDYYGLTDGTGLQAFVLIASRTPLPAFGSWRQRAALPWEPTPAAAGAWRFDGRHFDPLTAGTRGERRVAGAAPPALSAVCAALGRIPGVDAVRAVAFPVEPERADPAGP